MRARLATLIGAIIVAGAGFWAPAAAQQAIASNSTTRGELRTGDATLGSGELVDTYTLEGRAGQRLVVRLQSTAFDPYLLMRGPGGFSQDNDDEAQGQSSALLDVRLPSTGRYTVSVTSYKAGERGAYTLTLGGAEIAPVAGAGAPGAIRVGETVRGTLAAGDQTLGSGEYVDTWRLSGRRGERFTIRLSSSNFDPYLLVRGPNWLSEENDDDASARGSNASRLVVTMPADGELGVSATSYKPGETGAYTLSVEAGGDATPVAQAPQNAPALALDTPRSGTLQSGDAQLRSGEFVDAYTFTGRRGQGVDIRLASDAFDPYLMIAGPGDFSAWNDDDNEAGGKNARLSLTLPADGAYTIRATSYESGESGAYRLTVSAASPVSAANAAQIALGQTVRGTLGAGDSTLGSGAFVDRYRFRAARGERVAIDLRSTAFDSMLTLIAPSGAREQNDDVSQGANDAHIETEVTETGDYVVMATGYGAGAGAYSISLQRTDRDNTRPPPATSSSGALVAGASVSGQLASSDATLGSGEYFDRYTFTGRRGETVALEMKSAALDSYLIVQAPSGTQEDNDDAGADTHDARVRWVLPEDGSYSVRATSYAARETGAYTLRFLSGTAAETQATQAARRGKVFAVMVGVSQYGGAGGRGDLAYTADDALKLAQALRRGGMLARESVTLTNAEATPAAVRAAFQRVAAAAGPDDLFLFFFSGHGGQTAQRAGGSEPDLKDETIVLRGGEIGDDEMAQMFSRVRARVSLLALDACFSGGFARDVVSRPGVMGLFSSEEDLTSAVAEKFEAGGYLSHFLRAGLSGEADSDSNRIVTAGEMSTYLRRQFAAQAADIEAHDEEGARGYQYLVVERGGVKVEDPVLMLP